MPLGLRARGGDGMRRGERDPDPEHVRVPGGLVGLRPVRRAPLAIRLGRVVGVDLQETAGGEEIRGDVAARPVIGLQVRSPERRQQHGEIEGQGIAGTVQGLVVDLARFDPLDVSAQDRLHPALAEQRLGPDLAGGQEALLPEHHPADAEVAQLVLVAQVDDVGQVPQPAGAQFVLDVEGVLERGALAGAHPVPDPDDQGLPLPGAQLADHPVECPRRLHRVPGSAHRQRVPVRSQPRGGGEVQLRPGGVDQVVVAQPLLLTLPAGKGVLDRRQRAARYHHPPRARSPPP